MMKKLLTCLIFLANVTLGYSQSKKFAAEMKEALYIHDTAKVVKSELASLEAFKRLNKKYKNEWLPSYWAAYLCTQIGRLEGRAPDFPVGKTGKDFFEDAMEYFKESKDKKGEMTDQEASDFLVLEGFIFGFIKSVQESEDEKERYQEMANAKFIEATKLNNRNPHFYVLRGINLLFKEDDEDYYKNVVAGIGLLDYAESIFNQAENRALTTYWSKDFIPFWRSRGEQNLKDAIKVLEEEDVESN